MHKADTISNPSELTRDVEVSRREFAEGKGIPARLVFDELRSDLLAKKKAHP